MDLALLGGDAHLLAAAPGDGADIGILEAGALQRLLRRRVDLGEAVGDPEAENLARAQQALAVLGQLEDLAFIGPLALEDGRGIMHGMGQDMDLGPAPVDEFAVEPDEAVAVVEGGGAHWWEAPRSEVCAGIGYID